MLDAVIVCSCDCQGSLDACFIQWCERTKGGGMERAVETESPACVIYSYQCIKSLRDLNDSVDEIRGKRSIQWIYCISTYMYIYTHISLSFNTNINPSPSLSYRGLFTLYKIITFCTYGYLTVIPCLCTPPILCLYEQTLVIMLRNHWTTHIQLMIHSELYCSSV